MTKKQRTLEIIERLKKEYPDAACTLDYDQAWKLLVSVRLAAQCTDARVNVVVEGLFENTPVWKHWQRQMWKISRQSCVPAVWERARHGISVPA